ncbi:MAG: MFS transporter [Candidatus Didemnitutus sp.]|nr:MFS transporter [Candidatus Didemnitutus sp.]
MNALLRDPRAQRLIAANLASSVGSGITIIAVPWLLVNRPAGSQIYGWTTALTTLAVFLFAPYYGAWVDRHSRKTMLLIGEVFGATATLSLALLGLWGGGFGTWHLVAVYFCGMFYYTLHYPAKFAFVQQVFGREHYQSLTSAMEIQGQTAAMIAGGLASVLLDRVSLSTILLVDAATYGLSFVLLAGIPYTATHQSAERASVSPNAWRAVAEAWAWLRARPALAMFLLCSFTPFLGIMVGNYLFPIYVAQTLHASPGVYGRGEMIFALGAIGAGLTVPLLTLRHGHARTTVLLTGVFLVALALLAVWPRILPYYFALLLLGLGNAGVRVARNVIVLEAVPNAIMGRIHVFFLVFERSLRTVLILLMAALVDGHGAPFCFFLLLLVNLAAFAGLWRTRPAAEAAQTGAA